MNTTILLLSSDPVVSKQGLLILETIYPPKKYKGNIYSTVPRDIYSIEFVHDKLWRFTGLQGVTVECQLFRRTLKYPPKTIDIKPTEKGALREASQLCIEWNKKAESADESVISAIENNMVLVKNNECHIAIGHVFTVLDEIDKYIRNHRHCGKIKAP